MRIKSHNFHFKTSNKYSHLFVIRGPVIRRAQGRPEARRFVENDSAQRVVSVRSLENNRIYI